MSIQFLCPSGHQLSVEDSRAGKLVRCSRCKKLMYVPAAVPTAVPHDDGTPAAQTAAPPSPGVNAHPTTKGRPAKRPGSSQAYLRVWEQVRKAAADKHAATIPAPGVPTELASVPAQDGGVRKPAASPAPAAKPPPPEKPASPPTPAAAPQPSVAAPKPVAASGRTAGPVKRFWARFRRSPADVPADAYRPEPAWVKKAKRLALVLGIAVALSLLPVVLRGHWSVETSPGWARAVLLLAAIQVAYIAWMLNVPHWASLRVLMLVFALSSAGYALVMTMALTISPDGPMPWGMADVRYSAAAWCAAMLAVMSAATWLCGRTSTRWRRSVRVS